MPDRLVLFDIDCTLIDAHGAGGRAILRAIKDVYGVEGELGDYSFHGRTDPGIISDLAALWGAGEPDGGDGSTGSRLRRCASPATSSCCATRSTAARWRPCPASASWSRRSRPTAAPSSACSPATWRRGPVSSSSRRACYSLFKVGAYGSDSALRADLPAVAVARAEALDRPALRRQGRRRHRRHAGRRGVRRVTRGHGRRRRHRPAQRGRARRARAGPPLRRLLGLARGLRRHHGLTAALTRGRVGSAAARPKAHARRRSTPAKPCRERRQVDRRRRAAASCGDQASR